ncbi:MAG: c-type cytochrome [Methylocystis sp.]
MLRFAPLAVASCLLLAAGVASAKPVVDARLLNRGRAIAQQNCGRCHAVGAKGESANPKSPPFRLLARKYPLSNLEEALAEGIVVGHEGLEMPQFRLSVAQIEALLAYLKSIQR